MPNITRGGRMGGLMVYLASEGRHNEHRDPHLVAGDPAIMAWHDDAVLDRDGALEVARDLDAPRRAFGTEVTVPVRNAEGQVVDRKDAHVWHCSLALSAEEGQLSDAQWAAIATDFVEAMDFTEASGKAACRWVAVRHGLSIAGNDHVHLAVSLVREDGTKAAVHNDRPRAQRIAGELERKHGLQVLASRDAGRGTRGVLPAEQALTAKRSAPETDRARLARTVRAAAAAAGDEAEFVRRCRRSGLAVRPRYAHGRDDVVMGYSVGRHTRDGQQMRWYGGGHLAKDLTLPRLRRDWPDSPEGAGAAVAEWKAARRGQRPVQPGREVAEPDPKLWQQYAEEVGRLREHLRAVPIEDQASWAQAAKDTAGAFAAWSTRAEPTPGPLAAAADTLARTAQLRAHQVPTKRVDMPSARGAALLLTAAAKGGQGKVAEAVLLRQLLNTMKAVHDAHRATGDAREAARLASTVHDQLSTVAARLPAVPAAYQARGGDVDDETMRAARASAATQARPPGSPVPSRLDPERPQVPSQGGKEPDRGVEK